MENRLFNLIRFLIVCVFALMIGALLIPQTASAADDPQAATQNDETPKITVRWSSIDGVDLVDPLEFDIPSSGISIRQFLNDSETVNKLRDHFKKNGYTRVRWNYADYTIGFKPMTYYNDETWNTFYNATYPNTSSGMDQILTEPTELYFYSHKKIGELEITVDPLVCGVQIKSGDTTNLSVSGENVDKISRYSLPLSGTWENASGTYDFIVVGGQDYYISPRFQTTFGYSGDARDFKIIGAELVDSSEPNFDVRFTAKVTAVHDWDTGEETIPATNTSEGVKTYTCKGCNETKTESIPKLTPSADPGSDPNQKGSDGTPVGPGASAAAAERAITNMVSDSDPQGTVFGKLALKSPKQTKTSIDLSWNMVPGASSYVIYGNRCGKGIKPVKLAVVNSNKQTVSTIASQKVIKGTYYKFIAVALDKNNNVVSTSKVIHVATKGGKVGNHKKVTVSKSVIKKAKKLKKGKTLKLKAKAVPQSKKLKVKKHRAVLYESSNINIATVSKKGVVKAKSKGTCYVYAYAQNGVFKKIKVTVK